MHSILYPQFVAKLKTLLFFSLLIIFTSCEKDCNCQDACTTQLTVNNYNTEYNIDAVELVGYDFSPVFIPIGQSQTFNLIDGPIGGIDDILIKASFDRPGRMQLEETIDLVECGEATVSFY